MERASKPALVVGWILSIVPAGFMVMSGVMKLMKPPQVTEGMAKFGWPVEYLPRLAAVELACVAIYLFPRTAVLGAILMTGYLGGACATHARLGDPALVGGPILGILAWLGLYLRDRRIRAGADPKLSVVVVVCPPHQSFARSETVTITSVGTNADAALAAYRRVRALESQPSKGDSHENG